MSLASWFVSRGRLGRVDTAHNLIMQKSVLELGMQVLFSQWLACVDPEVSAEMLRR